MGMESSSVLPIDPDWIKEQDEIVKQAIEKSRMKRVIVESPYAGNVELNEVYAELAMYDCLVNYNESPYASHLLYTRKFVLDDKNLRERELGIDAGFYWREVADETIFYTDLGVSSGMKLAMNDCIKKVLPCEMRKLPENLWTTLVVFALGKGIKIERNLD